MGERGRKPSPNSYICNLNDITFAIACRQPPSLGTEIELVVPAIFSCPLEEAMRMIFLLDKKVYKLCGLVEGGADATATLHNKTMRRNFHILDSFPIDERRTKYDKEVIEVEAPETGEKLYLTYYWRSLEEKNSAFRR